mmetsp:Transcript_85600/g.242721  ORF Transcript_85600/g.242721 Transcript_85600/m.242721 type:complete len:286 (-) Transcript_85600:2-859(-)
MAWSRSSEACGNSTLSSRLNCSLRSWKSTFRSLRRSLTFAIDCCGLMYCRSFSLASVAAGAMRLRRASCTSNERSRSFLPSTVMVLLHSFQSGHFSSMECLGRPRSSTLLTQWPVSLPMGPLPVISTTNFCCSAIFSSVCAFEGLNRVSSMRPARTFSNCRFRSRRVSSFFVRSSAVVDAFQSRGSVPKMLACFFFCTLFFDSRTSLGTSPLWKTFCVSEKLILSLLAEPTWNLLVRYGRVIEDEDAPCCSMGEAGPGERRGQPRLSPVDRHAVPARTNAPGFGA